jgi:hypothetical protein
MGAVVVRFAWKRDGRVSNTQFLIVTLAVALPACLLIALTGALITSALTRRELAQANGTFRCNARIESGEVPGLAPHYRWRWHRATWMHNVLIIHRGRLRTYVHGLAVQSAGGMADVDANRISVLLNLDSGAAIRVMSDSAAMTSLVGPFLMAELDHVAKAKPTH